MSTSVLHHLQVRYLYYRCRSHAGGRPPYKGVSVSAFQLEQIVCEQTSALRPEQFRNPGRRQVIADFQALWAEVDKSDQPHCLREVIEKVEFDTDGGKLQITLLPGAAGYLMKRQSGPQ